MGKIIYISLPITGLDLQKQIAYADKVEKTLGHFYDKVLNPFNNGVPIDAHPSEHMRADFKMLLSADSILMCEGWEESSGCVAEWTVAKCCHMDIKYESDTAKYFR
jgi:hypothetical protein